MFLRVIFSFTVWPFCRSAQTTNWRKTAAATCSIDTMEINHRTNWFVETWDASARGPIVCPSVSQMLTCIISEKEKKTLKNIWLHRNQNRNDLCRIKQLQRKQAEQMAIPLRFNEASTSCSNTFSIHESVYMHLTEESKRNFTRNCVQTQQAGHINNNTKTRFYM